MLCMSASIAYLPTTCRLPACVPTQVKKLAKEMEDLEEKEEEAEEALAELKQKPARSLKLMARVDAAK